MLCSAATAFPILFPFIPGIPICFLVYSHMSACKLGLNLPVNFLINMK